MKKLFSFFIFAAFLFIGFSGSAGAKQTSAPTILEIGKNSLIENSTTFYIKGLTMPDTDVLVYLNDKFSGLAKVKSRMTSADSFYYSGQADYSFGQMEIKLIARDKKTQIESEPQIKKYEKKFPPPPTIIFPSSNDFVVDSKISILGLSVNDTAIRVMVDGSLVGQTAFLEHSSGVANFSFLNNKILSPGVHRASLQAEDFFGNMSAISTEVNFKIEHPMPAPTMKAAVANKNTNSNRPFITGLTKNNSIISVFIDNEYDGRMQVENHKSGTANFAYKPSRQLNRGTHTAIATATDFNGKESKLSNPIIFQIKTPMISASEPAEEKNAIKEIAEPENGINLLNKNKLIENSSVNKNIFNNSGEQNNEAGSANQEIQKILGQNTSNNNPGLINENKNKGVKINFNLIVFMASLLGIIIWIIWVNQELINEKKRASEEDSQNQPNEINITEELKDKLKNK